jgi:hypothetical protein
VERGKTNTCGFLLILFDIKASNIKTNCVELSEGLLSVMLLKSCKIEILYHFVKNATQKIRNK